MQHPKASQIVNI